MPDLDFWNSASEIRALANVAAQKKITFSLRGSVAEIVVNAHSSGSTVESLLGILPPFCDLDFLVDTHGNGRVLEGELAAELPASRFLRIDVLTPDELERYRNSNLIIENLPRIVFGDAKFGENDFGLQWESNGEVKLVHEASVGIPTVKRGEGELRVADALNDIAHVARRHPDLLNSDPLQELRDALMKRPEEAVAQTRGHRERKLLFTLVKLLLFRAAHEQDTFSNWLDDKVWDILERHKNRRFSEVLGLLRERPQDVVVAAVPRRKGSVWLSDVEHIRRARIAPVRIKLSSEKVVSTFLWGRMSPVRIITDEPERPGCCRYRDFSRGVTEVGWAGPRQYVSKSEPDEAALALIGRGDDAFMAPALRSSDGQQHAIRIDYGFICQLTGEARSIEIHPAGADDAG